MAEHFHDTSAAVKHYHTELGTAKVDRLLADTASRDYALSTLGVIEIHSVFALLVRVGQAMPPAFPRLGGRLLHAKTWFCESPLNQTVVLEGRIRCRGWRESRLRPGWRRKGRGIDRARTPELLAGDSAIGPRSSGVCLGDVMLY